MKDLGNISRLSNERSKICGERGNGDSSNIKLRSNEYVNNIDKECSQMLV